MITLGDEFQGLLYNGRNVFDIIEFIQQEMYPVAIRFGIGIGEITTDIITEMAIGADGPGYYNAREASNQAECAAKFAISQFSVQRILSSGNYYAYKEAIETINNVFEEVGRK